LFFFQASGEHNFPQSGAGLSAENGAAASAARGTTATTAATSADAEEEDSHPIAHMIPHPIDLFFKININMMLLFQWLDFDWICISNVIKILLFKFMVNIGIGKNNL
jgi:hypothetical protein